MKLIDYYYRGFKQYREVTEASKACVKDRRYLKKANIEFDYFKIKKYSCTINDDWVKEIEKGLEFVEKAVQEERQFIRVNGEIVPIEKVKKISRYSVEHLAKHSNMITHVPENPNDTLVPDNIYMVEKLSDYAVYENRFLYMLLCYLRDFISLRLEKIEKLRHTYICDFSLKKSLESKIKSNSFETSYHEERYDNPYPIKDTVQEEILKRIEDCEQIIIALLNTNLMVEVAKTPMIKPPIVKTNVLKMNNNFKNSLALYDYIIEYNSDGYEAKEVEKDFVPLKDIVADELVELGCLTEFLTYKFGNEITDILEVEFQIEEERRKKLEEEKFIEQIKRLKKRVVESGMGMEEYMLALEKRNRMLEEDSRQLVLAKNEIIALNNKINELNQEIGELNRKIDTLNRIIEDKDKEIAYLNQKYIDDMNALKKAHEIEIAELKLKHENEINDLTNSYEEKLNDLKNEYEDKLSDQESYYENELNNQKDDYEVQLSNQKYEFEKQIEDINEKFDIERKLIEESTSKKFINKISELENTINELENNLEISKEEANKKIEEYNKEIKSLNDEISDNKHEYKEMVDKYESDLNNMENHFNELISTTETENNSKYSALLQEKNQLFSERNLYKAENRSLKVKAGMIEVSDDLTTEERFNELEEEFLIFNDFFIAQWERTKKAIRKQIFWTKPEKKTKNKKEE